MHRVSPWCSTGSSQRLTSTNPRNSSATGIVAQPPAPAPRPWARGAAPHKLQMGAQGAPSGHQAHHRILLVPLLPLPSSLLPALFAHEFPSTRCDRRQRGAAQIPPWCLRSRGCRGVEGQSRELLLMENTSHGEDFQHRTQERERGKEIGCAGGGEAREGQEGRGDTAVS